MDTAKSADFKLSRRLDLRSNIAPTGGTLPARCACGGKLDFVSLEIEHHDTAVTVLKCRDCWNIVELP